MNLFWDLISQWFRNNLDIVFFIYGLAMVAPGIAILAQLRKKSTFKLANILWLLAGFGLIHGTKEFLDMWSIIRGKSPALDSVRVFILVISYLFLFEFGRRFFRICEQKYLEKITKLFGWWLTLIIGLAVFIFGFMSTDFCKIGTIWARYLLGLPGGLLISFGFVLYYKYEEKVLESLKVKKYFFWASFSFLVYGILGGLIVPKANFFPSNWVNTDSFIRIVHIPVPIFRAICSIIIAWAIGGLLRIFSWETKERLEEEIAEHKKAEEKIYRQKEFIESIINALQYPFYVVDTDYNIVLSNKEAQEKGAIIGNRCYQATHNRQEPCSGEHSCSLKEVIRTKKPVIGEHIHYDKDGNGCEVEVYGTPIFDKDGRVVQMIEYSIDITKRKKAEEALKGYTKKIEQINKELDDFTYVVSHDLKEPLRSIDAFSKFLEDDYKDKIDEEGKGYIKRIRANSLRMQNLIEDLLDISRIERQRNPIEEVQASDLINEVKLRLEYTIKEKNVEIVIQDALPKIFCDRVRLVEVFANLFSNAIKFNYKPNPRIEVGCTQKDDDYEFYVKDNGPGIEEQYFDKIFEIFQRLGKKEDHEGTGAGLTIVKKIVEMHKGKIWVESKVGEYTTFYFTIPKKKQAILGKKKIGEILVEKQRVTKEELKKALDEQERIN